MQHIGIKKWISQKAIMLKKKKITKKCNDRSFKLYTMLFYNKPLIEQNVTSPL